MTQTLRRIAGWGRQVLLTSGAVIGVVCILLTLGGVLFGLRPLVFQSGSMSPAIGTGALALSHRVDAAGLEVGQIVSVPTDTDTRVTHRIIDVTHSGDSATLRLQGYANETADAQLYPVTHADVVVFSVPRLGYVVGGLTGPIGLFLLGLYAAFLISVLVKRPPDDPSGDGKPDGPVAADERIAPTATPTLRSDLESSRRSASLRKANDKARLTVNAGLSVLLASGSLAGAGAARTVTPTLAAWSDPVSVSGAKLTAGTVPATSLSCSRLTSPNRTQFTWTPVPTATSYTISFTGGTAMGPVTQTSTTYVDAAPSVGRVAKVVVNRVFASTTWTSVGSNTRTESNTNGTCA